MHRKFTTSFLFLVLAITLGSFSAAARADFSGYWTGTWSSSNVSVSGRVEATARQDESSISGNLSVFGDPGCSIPILNAPLTGTATGDTATFNAESYDPCNPSEKVRLVFTNGTLSGNTLTGNYKNEFNEGYGWEYWDHGTFSLNRVCCTINATAGSGGSIIPPGTITLAPGENQAFSILPNTGYAIANVLVNDVSQGPISTYTFNNIREDAAIFASFRQDCCTVTATAGVGGSITPSGATTVTFGSNQTFTISPNPGYLIKDVKVDNISKGPITSYTFSSIDSNHIIKASFVKPKTLPFIPTLLEDE